MNKYKISHALLLSLLICTLPPFQFFVGIIHYPYTLSMLFASLASFAIFKGVSLVEEKRFTLLWFLIAITSMIISLHIHQSTATIYWSLALVPFATIKDKDSINKKFIGVYLLVGFISILIYYLSVKILIFLIDFKMNDFERRGKMITIKDLPLQIINFIRYHFYTASNLWNVFPKRIIGIFVGMVILLGILNGIFKPAKKQNIRSFINSLWRYLIIVIIIFLSYFPNIIFQDECCRMMIAPIHTITGLEIAVLLLVYTGLFINLPLALSQLFKVPQKVLDRITTSGLIFLVIIATLYAHQNINNFVKLHTGELEYIKNTIKDYGVDRLSKDSKIILIAPSREVLDYHSFFTLLSSGYNILYLAMYELGVDPDVSIVFYKDYDNLPAEDKNSLTIDMREYQKKAYKELNIPLSVKPFF